MVIFHSAILLLLVLHLGCSLPTPQFFQMNETLQGVLMRKITPQSCSEDTHLSFFRKPNRKKVTSNLNITGGIHIVLIASLRLITPPLKQPPKHKGAAEARYHDQMLSIRSYAASHGYKFHTMDPLNVIRKYGRMHSLHFRGHDMKDAKPIVMLYMIKEIFHTFGCKNAEWVLFLDMDVLVVDRHRSIESIIRTAHSVDRRSNGRSPEPCEIVAQDSPSTINTGAILVRISPFGQSFLESWVRLMWTHIHTQAYWQEDQGWFQYAYLRYIVDYLGVSLPVNCASSSMKFFRHSDSAARNLCYAGSLQKWGLLPGARSVGRVCLLAGLSSNDRVNMHDWLGVPNLSQDASGMWALTHQLPPSASPDTNVSCLLNNVFLYHGKEERILDTWRRAETSRVVLPSDQKKAAIREASDRPEVHMDGPCRQAALALFRDTIATAGAVFPALNIQ